MSLASEYRSEYLAYCNARLRCNSASDASYKHYGGRGIQFRFRDFREFLQCLGRRPKGYVLDRSDNDGHYEANNVRWVTPSVSVSNKRKHLPRKVYTKPTAERRMEIEERRRWTTRLRDEAKKRAESARQNRGPRRSKFALKWAASIKELGLL